jgi:hypothetical protein
VPLGVHVSPGAHDEHCSPALPHAVTELPARHSDAEQHPVQLAALHPPSTGLPHEWLAVSQSWNPCAGQFSQAWPAVPQTAAV